ncbi:ABC transporter substrate-binding protein [Noviherbaspirillum sedimenti]|uniref:ABC transporter substrate-binding protein n=1 Tax=Noviherbaspirillum sedimenti TaxID=2320865 RepID=A0A3A3FWN7_9BURK|nr:ABC transporter substrate-binding protein [Noviherbaspirillum sedimenti]RJG00633.1 ABC transporter substrate-binding protein [Noviherbaspirillum sedimenti]
MMSDSAQKKPVVNPRRPTTLPYRVGLLIDWAYETAPVNDYADAITLACEEAHAKGLIDRPVELVVRRVYGGPNASALDVLAAFRELINERVLAVIGPTLPDDMMACRQEFDRAATPVLSFGGTMGISSPYVFQLPNGTYADEVHMIVNYARASGCKSIGLLRDQTLMGMEYQATFALATRDAGIRVAGVHGIRPSPDNPELLEGLKALRDADADALLVISVSLQAPIEAALKQLDWSPMKLMVCNFVASIPGFDGAEPFEGWVGIDQYHEENPVFRNLVARFSDRFGRHAAHTYQAIGYDIGRALCYAFSMMAPATPEGLREALEKVRMLPAAAGGPGTVISFSQSTRRGYQGNYLVYRRVTNGRNEAIGTLGDHLYK